MWPNFGARKYLPSFFIRVHINWRKPLCFFGVNTLCVCQLIVDVEGNYTRSKSVILVLNKNYLLNLFVNAFNLSSFSAVQTKLLISRFSVLFASQVSEMYYSVLVYLGEKGKQRLWFCFSANDWTNKE